MDVSTDGILKYKTLAELKAAYDKGELAEDCYLYLDNDHVGVYDNDSDLLFEGHPASLLEEALTLLGIPWSDV